MRKAKWISRPARSGGRAGSVLYVACNPTGIGDAHRPSLRIRKSQFLIDPQRRRVMSDVGRYTGHTLPGRRFVRTIIPLPSDPVRLRSASWHAREGVLSVSSGSGCRTTPLGCVGGRRGVGVEGAWHEWCGWERGGISDIGWRDGREGKGVEV